MSIKNSIDATGTQTRDLLTCSAVPQPTAPPYAAHLYKAKLNMRSLATIFSIVLKDVLRQWLSIKLCEIVPILI